MRAGLLVLSSRYTPVTEDFVEDGVTGRVIDPLDSVAFARALVEAHKRTDWATTTGARALERLQTSVAGDGRYDLCRSGSLRGR